MSTAERETSGSRPGELHRRRVVLVSGSAGLAAMLEHLLGSGGALTRFASLHEAVERDGLADADTAVLDLAHDDAGTLGELRRRYGGELIVLAERGHRSVGVPAESTWTLVERPFSTMTLAAALGLSPPGAGPAPAPALERGAPADSQASREDLVERASRVAATVVQGWRERRRVRVAGFSAFALVAFSVAFALAAQSRCGPGCDALGTGFSPPPTIAPASSGVPTTTGPKRVTTTTVIRVGPAGAGAFEGSAGRRSTATSAVERRATVTTGDPSPGGGGPRPTTPTTRPATTTPTTTPTTAPTTTIALPTTTTITPSTP